MSSSYFEFEKKGFWIGDGVLELVAGILYKHYSDIKKRPDWISDYLEHLDVLRHGNFRSFMSFRLDELLENDSKRVFFIQNLKVIRQDLERITSISIDELNQLVGTGEKGTRSGLDDQDIKLILIAIDGIIDVLERTVAEGYDPYGFLKNDET